MNKEEFSAMLLEVLKDFKFCKKVLHLLKKSSDDEDKCSNLTKSNESIENNKNEQNEFLKSIETLNNKNEKLQKELNLTATKLKDADNEIQLLKSKLKKANDTLKPFESLLEVIQIYQQLPDVVKKTLKNILNDKAESFIVCGTDLSRIKNFAETIRIYTTQKEYDLAEQMNYILKYFISIYETINDKAKELKVKIGESFDDEKHIHCEGKNRVKVTRVLACGLMLKGEVCLKALVV